MTKVVGKTLLFLGVSGLALAAAVPEIDSGSAGMALTLLSGTLLILRGRRQ